MGRDRFSRRALRALGEFGLTTDDLAPRDASVRRASALAAQFDAQLGPGRIGLVCGPSGAGKSTLLRQMSAHIRAAGGAPIEAILPRARDRGRRVIELLARSEADVPIALRAMSQAGLADARLAPRRVQDLSDGEQARLAIAHAMVRAEAHAGAGSATMMIDELCGTLDDATGEGVCEMLARWARRGGARRIVAASARADVARWLNADVEVRLGGPEGAGCGVIVEPGGSGGARPCAEISEGSLDDFRRLAHLHDRASPPATCVRVLIARTSSAPGPIGVLTVSMPTLNGAWRAMAWPGEYDAGVPARERAARINRDIRCISRVIVDPRWRARGIGVALVRAYLADPLTRRTEAVAAMGSICPLFTRAGMAAWTPPDARRDSRLRDALDALGLRPLTLADVDAVVAIAEERRWLERALRSWANDHGATRALASGPLRNIVRAAARKLIVRAQAFTWEQG